ncbi:MAG: s-methyl-5-thioribose-1-phosphate isomerase [Chloroflexi bacterium]|nr:s-methyl-5-thioribose-1-phosphate isomerase [Chloroflexota bacterium]
MTECPALLADRFNTLRYDAERGAVILLDRRLYPFATEYIECYTAEEVALAIEEMVVQGGPPLAYAAGLGLALAAFQNSHRAAADRRAALRAAAVRLLATRPTADDLHHIVPQALAVGVAKMDGDESPGVAVLDFVNGAIERGNRVSRACGEFAAGLIADGDRILTHCFAGAALAWMLWIAKEQGKRVHLYPTETRPYLQGARLTAATATEMGIPCTLITDNMPAFLMSRGVIDKFICAADRITLDGHITNKIGTFQIALAAHHHHLPFYVLGYDGPDPQTATGADIPIEERKPDEIFFARGIDPQTGRPGKIRTAVEGIDGYYPAFDITPPELIAGIVTDRGIFEPSRIREYIGAEKHE